jgi:hypothetical protein
LIKIFENQVLSRSELLMRQHKDDQEEEVMEVIGENAGSNVP